MHQTGFPSLGRRRSIAAQRQAEIIRQHYAQPAVCKTIKGECPGCKKTFKRLDKHRCKAGK